jgi:hypothetical protein
MIVIFLPGVNMLLFRNNKKMHPILNFASGMDAVCHILNMDSIGTNFHASLLAQKRMKLVGANSVRPWRTNNPDQPLIDYAQIGRTLFAPTVRLNLGSFILVSNF